MKKSILVLIAVFAIGFSSFGQSTKYNYVYSVNHIKKIAHFSQILSADFEKDESKHFSKLTKQYKSYLGLGKGYKIFGLVKWTDREAAEEHYNKELKYYKHADYTIIYEDNFRYNNR